MENCKAATDFRLVQIPVEGEAVKCRVLTLRIATDAAEEARSALGQYGHSSMRVMRGA